MRRITKIRRSVRAISPIIATLLLIAIAVAASLIAYAWVMGYFHGTSTKVTEAIMVSSTAADANGNLMVYVQNVGQVAVRFDSSMNNVLYAAGQMQPLSGILVNNNPLGTGSLSKGQTATLTTTYPYPPSGTMIKVVTADGDSTQYEIIGSGTTSTTGSGNPNYVVNFVLGTGGSTINPNAGIHTYNAGSTVYISTVAATGYVFSSWSSNSGSITFDSTTSISTNAHIGGSGSITANFVQIQGGQSYPVTFVLGSGGASMTPTGTQTYADGSSVALTATAASGYQFLSWTSTGSITFDSSVSSTTYAHIAGTGSIYANFVVVTSGQNYQVTFVLGAGGASMTPTGTQTYASGSSVPLTATAAAGYQFSSWSSAGTITFDSATSASTNAHIGSAGTVTANFVAVSSGNNYQVTFALGSGGASMSPSGVQTYASGTTVPITGTASSGYVFSGWSSSTGSITFDSATSASTNAHIGGSGTITANFASVNSGNNYQVTFNLGAGGASMTPTGTQTYADGSSVPLTATAATGYQFSSWSSTGTITFDSATSASTNAHIGSAGTVTANFVAVSSGNNYQVTFNLGAGGASMSPVGIQTYASGTSVPLTATAATGYQFSTWSSTGTITFDSATSASTNAHIGGSGSVTANFVVVNTGQAAGFAIIVPSSATAGTSFTITVTAQDESGNTVTSYAGTVTFTSSDGQAVLPAASTLTSGTGTFTVTLKTAGLETITASDSTIASISPTITVSAATAASKLVYTVGTLQSITASTTGGNPTIHVSSVITVQQQDAYNNPVLATSQAVNVALKSSSTGGVFYSDSAGTTKVTTIPIAIGSSSANFYYSDTIQSTQTTLTASSGTLTPATTTFTINSYQLVFTTGTSQSFAVNSVSPTVITVQSQTPTGTSHPPGSSLTVTLTSSDGTGTFYSNAAGTQAIAGGIITIPNTSPYSATFYYKDTAQGTPTITASASAYTPATTTFTITGSATKLMFTAGATQSLYVGEVSPVITVTQEDSSGLAVDTVNPIIVGLTTTSSTGAFYGSGGTGAAITSVTIASGSSSASFTYTDTAAGSPTITATSAPLTPATTTFTITVNQVPDGGFGQTGSSDPWKSSNSDAQSYDTNDNAPALSGAYAEIDTSVATGNAADSLTDTFNPAIALSSIPNTAGSFSLYFYNNGNGGVASIAGYASFQITFTASDGTQLIYWWGSSPATAPTTTSTVKVINMGTIPGTFAVGKWVQFSRNLPADWTSNGLSSSASITSISLQGNGILSGGKQYGQEIFMDNVQIQ